MSITFVIVLPIGAFLIRLLKLKGNRALWIHAACQITGWAMMIVGLAMGVRMGKILDRVGPNNYFRPLAYFPASRGAWKARLTTAQTAPQQHPHYPWHRRRSAHALAAVHRP